ncbi:MAG: YbjN domain-containing protein [Rhodobacteraceae bacterium]|nr:YbjN domain-containing protein [Paracoccaceae bacterium]
MDAVEEFLSADDLHPIDLVESLAELNAWDFDRVADDQIAMVIEGSWRNYTLSLVWSEYDEILKLVCTFDLDPKKVNLPNLFEALDLANDQIWTGAFTLWPDQKSMVFRYGLNLCGGAIATGAQIDSMVRDCLEHCERFYPAFQLVCWGGETPKDAMRIAIGRSYGRA